MKKSTFRCLPAIKYLQTLLFITVLSGVISAATFTVTKTADTNDNICDGDCSLREAISAANAAETDDVINFNTTLFAAEQTITTVYGDLVINNNGSLVINGPGANLLTITSNYNSRVLVVIGATVTINNLLMTKGIMTTNSPGTAGGTIIGTTSGSTLIINNSVISNGYNASAIFNRGTLTINNSVVKDTVNVSQGGIYNAQNSTITINDSTISNNSSPSIFNDSNVTASITRSTITGGRASNGAGIYHTSGVMNITGSIFTDNIIGGGGGGSGGSIYNMSGTVTISNSTFSNNSAPSSGAIGNGSGGTLNISGSTFNNNSAIEGNGGAIGNSGVLNLVNSTVNNNKASMSYSFFGGDGGGISNGGTATIISSTISGNYADGNGKANGGGGISNVGIVNLRNTIVADNSILYGAPDFGGVVTSQGYNLIENTNRTTITGTTTGNITGRDPQLLSLGNYGGPTQTISLLATSPAIDSADPNNSPLTDQRGFDRPRDGDLNGSALPDIGAFEKQTTALTVTKSADTNDGVCDTDCSLREAVAAANAATTDASIIFDDALFPAPQTFLLTGGELRINDNKAVAFLGKGASLLTISGNSASRIFSINAGAVVGINGVTIANGKSATDGGGILNNGKLSVSNSIVRDSAAAGSGGGIFNNDRSLLSLENSTVNNNVANVGGGLSVSGNNSLLTIIRSTIRSNTASSSYGGGISTTGTVNINDSTISGNNGCGIYNGWITTVNSSTISGNITNGNGGGIFNDVTLNIFNSTVANNRSANQGGGIFRNAGTVSVRNSILADNLAPVAPDFSGILVSGGYNLIESSSGATINGSFEGNIVNQDARLAPLGNYGGATQTHALRLRSPAIDKGFAFSYQSSDQRGQTRPYDFPNISNSSNGNGADIGAFERQITDSGFTALYDYDGDGKSDLSVFRPANGTWYLQQSSAGFTGLQFGVSTDRLVPADYDGDGKTDVAVYRDGVWYLMRSSLGFTGVQFGVAEDIPVPGDFDADGKADLAVFRPSNGTWYLNRSSQGFTGFHFGLAGDKPVAADFDGDGKTDFAVFRSGVWYIQRSQLGFTGIQFGEADDKPVAADYDGDGKTDVAVFRPSNGTWYLQQSQNGFLGFQFGQTGDLPTPADYDGDGKADIAVYRINTWYLNRSTAGFIGIQFGAAGDLPAPNAFIR